ncbi:MAG: hypothetical protein OCC45_16340 [Desulfotalea sp.]
MEQILLFERVNEDSVANFANFLGSFNEFQSVQIDFSAVTFYTPAAMICLVLKVRQWQREGKQVSCVNCNSTYFQRMNLFKVCGICIPENFNRYSAANRFVPIEKISSDVEKLSTAVAKCLAPNQADSDDITKTGLFDFLEYAVSELSNNVIQHSQGDGFAMAQYMPTTDIVNIAIGDIGIGIKEGFRGSEHYDASMSDNDAIRKALQPEVSRNSGGMGWGLSPNMGVGMSIVSELAKKFDGQFALISGNGYHSSNQYSNIKEGELNSGKELMGTLFSLSLKRGSIKTFSEDLMSIKRNLGLIQENQNFSRMFK